MRLGQVFREVWRASAFQPSGWGDATEQARLVGGRVSTAPTVGRFNAGDMVVAQNGRVWVCSVSGSPGTWVQTATQADVTALEARVTTLEADVTALQSHSHSEYAAAGHTHGP